MVLSITKQILQKNINTRSQSQTLPLHDTVDQWQSSRQAGCHHRQWPQSTNLIQALMLGFTKSPKSPCLPTKWHSTLFRYISNTNNFNILSSFLSASLAVLSCFVSSLMQPYAFVRKFFCFPPPCQIQLFRRYSFMYNI